MAASGLLYIIQPQVIDPPPGSNPAEFAWFAQFSSGHLRHADQQIVAYAGQNSIPVTPTRMAWSEYQRLYAESHWYE